MFSTIKSGCIPTETNIKNVKFVNKCFGGARLCVNKNNVSVRSQCCDICFKLFSKIFYKQTNYN